jgi:hypothetical protein
MRPSKVAAARIRDFIFGKMVAALVFGAGRFG